MSWDEEDEPEAELGNPRDDLALYVRTVDRGQRRAARAVVALLLVAIAWWSYPGIIRDVPEFNGRDDAPEWAVARLRAIAAREHAEWENAHQGPPSPLPVAWGTDGTLAVADYANHRILVYSRPADVVLGQAGFGEEPDVPRAVARPLR